MSRKYVYELTNEELSIRDFFTSKAKAEKEKKTLIDELKKENKEELLCEDSDFEKDFKNQIPHIIKHNLY
ncbi:MAG: hypothetical protein GY909_15635 [Oligoflexia bacterium]|nr:hypothetical protein [Oligoflexia bacterium]